MTHGTHPPGTNHPAADELTRWARFVRSHLPMVVVTLVVIAAVVLVLADRWRKGALVFGVATLIAGGFRLLLPEARVGLLAVRSRTFDVAALGTVGAVVVLLAVTIDPLGTG